MQTQFKSTLPRQLIFGALALLSSAFTNAETIMLDNLGSPNGGENAIGGTFVNWVDVTSSSDLSLLSLTVDLYSFGASAPTAAVWSDDMALPGSFITTLTTTDEILGDSVETASRVTFTGQHTFLSGVTYWISFGTTEGFAGILTSSEPFSGTASSDFLAYGIAEPGGFRAVLTNPGYDRLAMKLVGGDVVPAPVPLPAAVWLVGPTLGVLGAMRRRKA